MQIHDEAKHGTTKLNTLNADQIEELRIIIDRLRQDIASRLEAVKRT
jgi:hypothetical protein